MRVIDLLNLVYKKKAPKQIRYSHCDYQFDDVRNDYFNSDGLRLFKHLFSCEYYALQEKVEVIEETSKEIEKIEIP